MEPKTKKIIGIFVVIILIALIILGLMINKNIFKKNISNVNSINDQLKREIDITLEQDKNLVIFPGGKAEKTATVERGTEMLGVPIGFEPKNPEAFGAAKNKCTYSIEIGLDEFNKVVYWCTKNGWTNPLNDIYPGTRNIYFDEVQDGKGYALIKIEIPKDVEPCIQPFVVNVSCTGYPNETVSNYFNVEIIKKKGLF
ncbi:MAG: hypothetical protein ACP5NZ_05105 [Nanobdellota archaeon]